MKRRLAALILAVLTLSHQAGAVSPADRTGENWFAGHFRCGVEWGYTYTFYESHHFNYLSDAGSRMDVDSRGFIFNSNGYAMLYAGLTTGRKLETDLFSGYAGLVQNRRGLTLGLRESFYFKGVCSDGFKLTGEVGTALCPYFTVPAHTARLGLGYRLMLTGRSSLDILLSIQGVDDHPSEVYVSEYRYIIPSEDLRRSDRKYLGTSFSLSLNF